jgi:hypothetical protein
LEALHGAMLCFRRRPEGWSQVVEAIAAARGIEPQRPARVIEQADAA